MENETYIKMVLAMPENFFSDWKYQNGDTIIVNESGEWNVYHVGEYISFDGIIGTIDGWECSFLTEDNEIRPLPSQKQLQDMISEDWRQAYVKFIEWYYERGYPFGKDEDCPEAMWLKLIMLEKYKKRWDGENWV